MLVLSTSSIQGATKIELKDREFRRDITLYEDMIDRGSCGSVLGSSLVSKHDIERCFWSKCFRSTEISLSSLLAFLVYPE